MIAVGTPIDAMSVPETFGRKDGRSCPLIFNIVTSFPKRLLPSNSFRRRIAVTISKMPEKINPKAILAQKNNASTKLATKGEPSTTMPVDRRRGRCVCLYRTCGSSAIEVAADQRRGPIGAGYSTLFDIVSSSFGHNIGHPHRGADGLVAGLSRRKGNRIQSGTRTQGDHVFRYVRPETAPSGR